jgi:hypothetical protein
VDKIVVELPAHRKALAQAVKAASAELLELERRTIGGRGVDMVDVEDRAGVAAARVECAMLGEVLKRLDINADRRGMPRPLLNLAQQRRRRRTPRDLLLDQVLCWVEVQRGEHSSGHDPSRVRAGPRRLRARLSG